MKHYFIFFCAFFASIIPTLGTTCPTCIGLPTKNSRPFFERRGIRYVIKLNPGVKTPLQPPINLKKKVK